MRSDCEIKDLTQSLKINISNCFFIVTEQVLLIPLFYARSVAFSSPAYIEQWVIILG